jgi:hypothetical protein
MKCFFLFNLRMQSVNYFILFSLFFSRCKLQIKDSNDTKYDFQREIVNFNNFSYIHNPEGRICSNQNVFLLVYVHTAPENYKKRLTIRETWSQRHLFSNVRIVFITGVSSHSDKNEILKLESNLYRDIIQLVHY